MILYLLFWQTVAMIKYLRSGVYNLDIGPLQSKYVKLPKLAFCAGKTIFEIDVQFD